MKKLLSIVVIAAAFTLVGCSAEKPGTTGVAGTGFAQAKETCKGKTCKHHRHHGKLGDERTTEDTAK
jgi:hypothetical protein